MLCFFLWYRALNRVFLLIVKRFIIQRVIFNFHRNPFDLFHLSFCFCFLFWDLFLPLYFYVDWSCWRLDLVTHTAYRLNLVLNFYGELRLFMHILFDTLICLYFTVMIVWETWQHLVRCLCIVILSLLIRDCTKKECWKNVEFTYDNSRAYFSPS